LGSADEVEFDAVDGEAELLLEGGEGLGVELFEDGIGEVVGDVFDVAGVEVFGVEVLVSGDVVSGGAVVAGEFLGEACAAECFESVVDGGEGDGLVRVEGEEGVVEFVGGGVVACGSEGVVDGLSLAGAAEAGGGEAVDGGGGFEVVVVVGVV